MGGFDEVIWINPIATTRQDIYPNYNNRGLYYTKINSDVWRKISRQIKSSNLTL